MSLPTDCDNRDERKGWMGDAALTNEEAFQNFDMPALYTNFLNLIQDEQSLSPDGTLPDTVPLTFGSRKGDPNWQTAYPSILYGMMKYHGDADVVRAHMPSVKLYVDWLVKQAEGGLANFYFEYADWVPPPEAARANGSFTSAFAFLHDIMLYGEMAKFIGDDAEYQRASQLFVQYGQEFNKVFFNPSTSNYLEGLQTSNALGLWLQVTGDSTAAVVKNIVNDIVNTNKNHLSTGIIGTKFLMLALSDNGQTSVATTLAAQTTYPSWGYMITNTIEPATTLWELWNTPTGDPGMDSRDHIMFGSIGNWFYTSLAGLDQAPGSYGYRTLQIKPRPSATSMVRKGLKFDSSNGYEIVGDSAIVRDGGVVDRAHACIQTCRGMAAVSWNWNQTSEVFHLEATVPVGSTALVHLPVPPYAALSQVVITEGSAVIFRESSFVATAVRGVRAAEYVKQTPSMDGPYVVVTTGSGAFNFQLRLGN